MKIIPFEKALVDKNSQSNVAVMFDVHQTTISKAHREKRNIFIVENDNGISAFELKPVFNSNPDLNAISDKLLKQPEPA